MKKIILLFLFCSSAFFAQNMADFKKNMDNGNAKFKIKSYALAIGDYDAAINIISTEVDKYLKANKPLPADKQFLVEPYMKRATCFYLTNKSHLMQTDLAKVAVLDSSNTESRTMKAYDRWKSGDKLGGCIDLKKQSKAGSEMANKIFEDCFCWSEGMSKAKDAASQSNVKKYDEALENINLAIGVLPDSGFVYAEKGKALYGKEKFDEALVELNTAIKLTKKSYKAYYYRALIYNKVSKTDSAFDDLSHCLNLNQKFYDAYYLRATLCQEQGKWSSAIYDLKECIRLEPHKASLDYEIAMIIMDKQEDMLDACEYFNTAMRKGHEESKDYVLKCNDPKYMKKHLHKIQKK